jgi:predicted nucleic acid-binding protein
MIFVDTNVFMYAVGRSHPLRAEAQDFFRNALRPGSEPLCTSAEVLQELLHADLPVGRTQQLDDALRLVESSIAVIHPIEADDIVFARDLADSHAALGARDLLHLATCRRRGIDRVKTFDRALAAEFS